jgi:hypothetical protein
MGFTAQYEAVCGGDLEMEAGQLESPNFPEDYQPNKECIWRIRNAGHMITLLQESPPQNSAKPRTISKSIRAAADATKLI